MYSQKETDDVKTKKRRLRQETLDNFVDPYRYTHLIDDRPNKQKNAGNYFYEFKKSEPETYYEFEDRKGKTMEQEFIDHMGRLAKYDKKCDDPWLRTFKTTEYEDFQIGYPMDQKVEAPKVTKMDILFHLPKVEVIRLLVSKLKDGQSPSDYIKTEYYKNKGVEQEDPDEYGVSDLAHVLTMDWKNVYFMKREDIIESLLNYKNNGKERKSYEFRWLRDELAVHGPYSHEDILIWVLYGYVSQENPILVRELDSDGNLLTHDWTHYMDSDIYNIFPSSDMSDYAPLFKSTEMSRYDNQPFDHFGYSGKRPDFLFVKKRRSRRLNMEYRFYNDDDDYEYREEERDEDTDQDENENSDDL